MPRAVAALHAAGLVRSGDPDRLVYAAQWAALVACDEVGVELGAYDERVLSWLARGEAGAVQVIADLIARAGRSEPQASGAADSDVAD